MKAPPKEKARPNTVGENKESNSTATTTKRGRKGKKLRFVETADCKGRRATNFGSGR